eukprot:GGOE01041555.1.p1 GENE.GGOE01041555.1~~GGOE01041555.1.p1  ORF type:complete len:309 (-),score=68.29 GGOE01041555.1:284-1117(-)
MADASGQGEHLTTDWSNYPRPRPPQLPAESNVVVLDIEGTTTLISFVHDELFPFARHHCRSFLESHWDDATVVDVVSVLRQEAADDVKHLDKFPNATPIPESGTKEETLEAVVRAVEWQMAVDRKARGLKALQGLIWKDGYASGELKGHLFEDAHCAMAWWKAHGVRIYIYSSGSVAAQKLLFGNSRFGDLMPLIDGYFDTGIGAKVDAASYRTIVAQLGENVTFVSDSEKELLAAKQGGVRWPVMCVRPGNSPLTPDSDGFAAVRSLLELCRCAGE